MNIREVIKIASKKRPELARAIGFGDPVDENVIPKTLETVYSVASGTKENINDSSLIDLIPGYRLIHISELEDEARSFHDLYTHLNHFTPFMADNSSAYIAVDEREGAIYRVSPDYEEIKMASNLEKFWETVYQCYEREAYFLDPEGYLDYDFDKEGEIGLSINPECHYWSE